MRSTKRCLQFGLLLFSFPAILWAQSNEERLLRLEQRMQSLSEIVLRLDQLQREVRQLRGELEQQNYSLEQLRQQQRDLYLDLDSRLSGQVVNPDSIATEITDQPVEQMNAQADPIETIIAVSSQPTASEQESYQQAFQLLTAGRYAEAIRAFQTFLIQFPQGSFADNAQYWLGEASYVSRDFATALTEFDKVLTKYPTSSKAPGALLKTGYIHYEQQHWQQARQILTQLSRQYPDTTEARLATKRLERMRQEGH